MKNQYLRNENRKKIINANIKEYCNFYCLDKKNCENCQFAYIRESIKELSTGKLPLELYCLAKQQNITDYKPQINYITHTTNKKGIVTVFIGEKWKTMIKVNIRLL